MRKHQDSVEAVQCQSQSATHRAQRFHILPHLAPTLLLELRGTICLAKRSEVLGNTYYALRSSKTNNHHVHRHCFGRTGRTRTNAQASSSVGTPGCEAGAGATEDRKTTGPIGVFYAGGRRTAGVSYITMYRLIQRGLIRASGALRHKVIPKSELDRFLRDTVESPR